MVDFIMSFMPPHETYVETHGGGAAVLLAKPRSKVEIYNDVNQYVVNFFRVIQNHEMRKDLDDLCRITPYSRRLFTIFKKEIKTEKDPVRKAMMFFYINKSAFGARQNNPSWSFCYRPRRNLPDNVSKWHSGIELLDEVGHRFCEVMIEEIDALKLIPKCDGKKTLFYVDPPYLPETRVDANAYECEMTRKQHVELLDMLLSLKGMVMLSGYENSLYNKKLKGWRIEEQEFTCRSSASKEKHPTRVEVLYLSPNCKPEKEDRRLL